jgi:hypothetical protein
MVVIGGILVSIGTARTPANGHLWSNSWFDIGIVAICVGGLALAWSLVLFLAHRHAEIHMDRELSIKLAQPTNQLVPMPPLLPPPTPRAPAREGPSVDAPSPTDNGEPSDLQRVFEESPPELADMSPALLTKLFAGKTEAQAAKLLEQHCGKPVRVSGVVQSVELPGTTQGNGKVTIRGAVLLLLHRSRHSQLAHPTRGLGDHHPADRLRPVSARVKLRADLQPVVMQPRPQLLGAHPVDAWGTGVPLDASERLGEIPAGQEQLPQRTRLGGVSGSVTRRRIAAAL